MKRLIALVLLATSAQAGDLYMFPTVPGTTIRDYSSPGYGFDQHNGSIYPTIPGTTIRNFSQPGYSINGNTLYPTVPGTTIRDFSRPGFVITR